MTFCFFYVVADKMELFKELQILYEHLSQDVELLYNRVDQPVATSLQQKHGSEILNDSLSNIRHLKVSSLETNHSCFRHY